MELSFYSSQSACAEKQTNKKGLNKKQNLQKQKCQKYDYFSAN